MIVSHKHEFIFIKTSKTAGTSIEKYLEPYCGDEDIIGWYPEINHRNCFGLFNPLDEIEYFKSADVKRSDWRIWLLRAFKNKQKFRQHLPATILRKRIGEEVFDSYYKFCFERNPFDKVISHYEMMKNRRFNGELSFDDYMRMKNLPVNHYLYMGKEQDDGNKELLVDFVGKYENLESDLKKALDEIGIPFTSLTENENTQWRKDKRPCKKFWKEHQEWIPEVRRLFMLELQFYEQKEEMLT